MRHLASSLLFLLLSLNFVNAQTKIKEKDVLGSWKLHLDLSKEIQSESSDLNLFEKMVLGAVSGIVDTAMKQADVQFNFKRNQEVVLSVRVAHENKQEEETLNWFINKEGQLEIDNLNNDNIQVNNEGVWVLKDNKLYAFENNNIKEVIYLERIK